MLKFLKRGIPTPVAITIIILYAVLVGGVIIWQYSRIPQKEFQIQEMKIESKVPEAQEEVPQQEVAPENETIHWQMYRNEKYGYEVKYPKDWDAAGLFAGHEDLGMVFGKAMLSRTNTGIKCNFSITHNASDEDVIFWISKGGQKTQTKIGGVSATKVVQPEFFGGPSGTYYYFEHRGRSFEIYHEIHETEETIEGRQADVTHTFDPEIDPLCEEVFKQILSTFRFLD